MDPLRELYQEVILDHGRRPRNSEPLNDASHQADGHNPLCGDRLKVFLRSDGKTIDRVTFEGNGCAISIASASLMTEALAGQTLEQAEQLYECFHDLVTGKIEPGAADERLGKLRVFSGVREFPVRVKCATLPWHTLRAALRNNAEAASTE